MRTTLSLDEDIAHELKQRVRRSGRSFEEVVNELLRLALNTSTTIAPSKPLGVTGYDLGAVVPGLNLENAGEALDQIEGSRHR